MCSPASWKRFRWGPRSASDLMPFELSKDVVELLAFLLPGFVTAWSFYSLSSYRKPSQFERVIEALIYTFVVQVIFLPVLRQILFFFGRFFSFGGLGRDGDIAAALILSLVLGISLALIANKDSFHAWLRSKGLTSRTSHPSEWVCAFSRNITYVVLHFQDGRRLYGWPKEWPVDPDEGQFFIEDPMWITQGDEPVDMSELDGVLVRNKDVAWVEFVSMKQKD